MEFSIGLESPFNLEYTLHSGQVFRWENRGEWWYGVLGGGVLKVKQELDSLYCVSSNESMDGAFVRNYFRLGDDLASVMASISRDKGMEEAVQRYYGLRLISQDFWECLASFVLATNTNIPRIKKMVSQVCASFGNPFGFEGLQYFSFPGPEKVADASEEDLKRCGLGYRAAFLKRIALSVAEGQVDGSELALIDYDRAKKSLLRVFSGQKVLLGVGPKVADCVLLYSCGKDEAFPVDVWIARRLAASYPKFFEERTIRRLSRKGPLKLSANEYAAVSSSAREYFGQYAGYAQLYLYTDARFSEQPPAP